jgi:VWFA-related protein
MTEFETKLNVLSRRRALLYGISLVPLSRLLCAQEKQQAPTFSTGIKVVNVFATVRDKQGQIVRDLTKDDFAIVEDGRPQTIRYFAKQSDLPLTLGLLVDTSGSERRMLGTERDASYTFFQQVLRPDKDKAFLIHFDREVELLQDVTSSRERLQEALDQLNKPDWGNGGSSQSGGNSGSGNGGGWGGGGGGRRGGGGGRGAGGTAFYDAVYLASDDMMQKQTGRKALIMLTDGEDNASKVSEREAIDSAQRADTLAYAVRIADEESATPFNPGMGRHGGGRGGMGGGWPGGGGGRGGPVSGRPDGKKILKEISKETGGGYFEVSKKTSVDQIYNQIEEELRNQYSLGYTSDRPDSESGFRKIEVTVKRKGLVVQARNGYYAEPSKPTS